MSAPSRPSGARLSKVERRVLKKQVRSQHTLFRHDQIPVCRHATRHMVIANGGLGNRIKREELARIFSTYGQVDDISMAPKKPYSFITFSKLHEAELAFAERHGKSLLCPLEVSVPDVTLYLSYIESVPNASTHVEQLPPGLLLLEEFISEEYEQQLLACLEWEDSEAARRLKHRKVQHYGYEFVYEVNNVDPTKPLARGIPPEADELLQRLINLGHIKHYPDQLTVNQYEPGQGIPPHIDTHSAFEDELVSLSLGSQVSMDFRHPDGRHVVVPLPRRSVLIMAGPARYVWTHGITPRKTDVTPVQVSQILASIQTGQASATTVEIGQASATTVEIGQASATLVEIGQSSATPVEIGQSSATLVETDQHVEAAGEVAPPRGDASDCPESRLKSNGSAAQTPEHSRGLTLLERGTRTSFTFRKILRRPCNCNFPDQCDSQKDKPSSKENATNLHDMAAKLEQLHVHQVYDTIASHFSDTRHKAWPRVAGFVEGLPGGSVMADVGCGNGKYLGINDRTFKIGCDRSLKLCEIAGDRGHEVFGSDVLALPLRSGSLDAAICIAVIHHLATQERRWRAVSEIVRVLRPGGRALIQVWAMEQERDNLKSNYLRGSRAQAKPSEGHRPSAGGVEGDRPSAGGVEGDRSSAGSVEGGRPSAGGVEGDRPSAGSVEGDRPSAGSVEGDRPSVGGVEGDRPSAGGVECDRPSAGGVEGDRPSAGGVEGDRPSPGGVEGDRPSAGGVEGDRPSAGGVEGDRPSAGGVKGDGPSAGGVECDRPSAGGVEGDRPSAGGVEGDRQSAGGVEGDRQSAGGVEGDRPSAGGVEGDRPSAGGVEGDRPSAGGVEGDRPSAGGVEVDRLSACGVEDDRPSAGGVEGDRLSAAADDGQQVAESDNRATRGQTGITRTDPTAGTAAAVPECPYQLPVHVNRTNFEHQDLLVPWHLKAGKAKAKKPCGDNGADSHVDTDATQESGRNPSVYHRFYHVFQKGELEALCLTIEGVVVEDSYYDKGNWCVVLVKV